MKKLACILISILYCFSVSAEAIPEDIGDEILYMDLPWYSDYETVDSAMEGMQVEPGAYTTISHKVDIDTIKYLAAAYDHSENRARDAGIKRGYANIPVAGYVTNATVYFMYTFDENGTLITSEEQSVFCAGMYTFYDLPDMDAIYVDLASKLTTLYGNSFETAGDRYFAADNWIDECGNEVCLFYQKDEDIIRLVYAPADLETKLIEFNDNLSIQSTNDLIDNKDLTGL